MRVSIYDLLTNFEELDRKKVTVSGYLVYGGGLLILYPTKEDSIIGDSTRGIGVHPIENNLIQDIRDCMGNYARIDGFFRRHNDFRAGHVISLVKSVHILDENNRLYRYSLCASEHEISQ